MRRRRILFLATGVSLAAMVLLTLIVRSKRGAEIWYAATFLPSLGGQETAATGINNRGQVTGFTTTAAGMCRFFLWEREHGIQDLGPAMLRATVYINDAGQIAGTAPDAGGNPVAFFWDPARGMQTLGTLGGKESMTLGLNNRGQVVGRAQTTAGVSHAFLWEQATGMQDLGTLGGARSVALSINDAGQVLGDADSATQAYSPFSWDAEKGMIVASPPAPASAAWFGLNNRGYVLGERNGQMLLWREDAGVRILFPGGASYIRPALNDVNQVIFGAASHARVPRWAERFFRPRLRCFLWDPHRGRIALDDAVPRGLGEDLYILDLNNAGCIVGTVARERRMRARAVLLEPIAEAPP